MQYVVIFHKLRNIYKLATLAQLKKVAIFGVLITLYNNS